MSDMPHKELRAYREQIDALDAQLRPYWDHAQELQLAVARTYPHFERPEEELRLPTDQRVFVLEFSWDGTARRRKLLAELDRLNHQHAPLTNQRRQLKSQSKALEAMIERLSKLEEAKRQKETEAPQSPQLRLF
jgi:prefoldin subunit 5